LGLLISLGILTAACVTWEIVRFASPRVNLWLVSHLGSFLKRGERGFQLTGTTYLLLASLVVFLCFERDIAVVGLLFLAIGDLVAAIIGRRWGRFRVFNKSIEGGLACLASCFIIGVVASMLSPVISIAMAAIGAVIAAIIELLPTRINDNLTIPIVSGGVMTLIAPVMG
jgi:glycerol-3-phosphate acyltransferase PlsY